MRGAPPLASGYRPSMPYGVPDAEEERMAALLHHQKQDYHIPRIWGWDVAGDIACAVTANYLRLVDLFGLEPPGVPFTVYIEPGVGSTAHHHGPTTTFFIGAEDPS